MSENAVFLLTVERIVSIMKIKKTSVLAIVVAVLLVAGATTVFVALAAPVRDIKSNVPDGYKSEVVLGADDNSLEDGPIDVDSMPGVLVAVNRNDENNFTPEEWADILEKIEKGEILFFETREEELDYFSWRSLNTDISDLPSDIEAEYTVIKRTHPVTREELWIKTILATGEVFISDDDGITWRSQNN